MKLRNKKTGEIRDFIINKDKIQTASAIDCWEYSSLAELNEEWEDYEEPRVEVERARDVIDFSNVRLPVVEIHRKVKDCSNHEAELIISLDKKTGVLTYRVVNKELGYDFVYTPLEFFYIAWKIIGEDK